VFIQNAGEFLPRTKQFKGDIFRVEVFVSPVSKRESLAFGFAFISIINDDSHPEIKDDHIQSN
jgi:hypothetical protein